MAPVFRSLKEADATMNVSFVAMAVITPVI